MKLPSSGPNARSHPLFAQNPSVLDDMKLFDHKNREVRPLQDLVYLPGGGKYCAQNWLRPVQIPGEPDIEVDVPYLHPYYLEDPPRQPLGSGWTWEDWLHHAFNLAEDVEFIAGSDDPRLFKGKVTLSHEGAFLIKYRSEEVLTILPISGGNLTSGSVGRKTPNALISSKKPNFAPFPRVIPMFYRTRSCHFLPCCLAAEAS